MLSFVLKTGRSEPSLIPRKLTNFSQANANRTWRIQFHCVVDSSTDLERLVDYVLYIIFYIIFYILSLFVYSLVLQAMWEALRKGVSRFKFIIFFKPILTCCANENNLRIYLGSNLKNLEGQQKLLYSYENDPSVKIVFLNKNFHRRPFRFTLSIPASFFPQYRAFRIYTLVTWHIHYW